MNADPQLSAIIDRAVRLLREPAGIDLSAMEDLSSQIVETYKSRTPPPPRNDQIRVCLNWRVFRGWTPVASATATYLPNSIERAEDMYPGDGRTFKYMRRHNLGALLYADQLVDQDPLSFEQYIPGREEMAGPRLAWSVGELLNIRPLIDAGIVLMTRIPPDTESVIDDPIESERWRAYCKDRGLEVSDWDDAGSRWYLRDALLTARSADATLVPRHAWEWAYLDFLTGSNNMDGNVAARVVSGLASVELPMFAGLPAELIVKLHQNEDAFEDWRVALRVAARTIRRECSEESFVSEAKEIYADLILPASRAAQRATSRSRALARMVREQPLRIVLGAGFGLGMTSALGLPAIGSVGSAIAGALANISYAGLSPTKAEGASAIVGMMDAVKR